MRVEDEIKQAIADLGLCEQIHGPSVECLSSYGMIEALKWVLQQESILPDDIKELKKEEKKL